MIIVSVRMKTMVLAVLMAISVSVQAQNVFLLGSNTPPPPALNGNGAAPAATYAHPAPVGGCAVGYGYAAREPYYPNYYPGYHHPNVMYVGGPGSCGPNYYPYARYDTPNVIYFGGMQAARHGYHFRHCR